MEVPQQCSQILSQFRNKEKDILSLLEAIEKRYNNNFNIMQRVDNKRTQFETIDDALFEICYVRCLNLREKINNLAAEINNIHESENIISSELINKMNTAINNMNESAEL